MIIAGIIGWTSRTVSLQTTLSTEGGYNAVEVPYVGDKRVEDISKYVPIIGLEEGLRESCVVYQETLMTSDADIKIIAKNLPVVSWLHDTQDKSTLDIDRSHRLQYG